MDVITSLARCTARSLAKLSIALHIQPLRGVVVRRDCIVRYEIYIVWVAEQSSSQLVFLPTRDGYDWLDSGTV